jgi:hypothetical protein
MTLYFIFMLFTFLYGLTLKHFIDSARVVHYLFYVLMFIFIFGFRNEVGADWFSYKANFNLYVNNINEFFDGVSELNLREIGFRLVNYFSYLSEINYLGVIFTTTLIFIVFSIYGAIKLNINPYYFLTLTFPFHVVMSGMNLTKQSLALAISFAGIHYLLENKKGSFVFIILLAASFHTSALILLAYLLIVIKKRYALVFSTMLFPIYILMSVRYEQYFESGSSSGGFFLRIAFVVVILVSLWILKSYWLKKSQIESRLYYSLYAFFIVIMFIALISSTMADRLSYYLIVFSAGLFLRIDEWRDPSYRLLSGVCYLSSLSLFIFWVLNSSYIDRYSFKWLF